MNLTDTTPMKEQRTIRIKLSAIEIIERLAVKHDSNFSRVIEQLALTHGPDYLQDKK